MLDSLAVLSSAATSEEGGDGALGWTGKSEVFTLGIRVVCAGEVVLAWNRGGLEDENVVRREGLTALRGFADRGATAEVHGLWLERIERVLEREVLGVLGRVQGRLLAAV